MPNTPTKYFGNLEYRNEDVIQFPSGIPAFEEEVSFLLVEAADRAPLQFLQSMRQTSLCFLALPILVVDPKYRLELSPEDLTSLGLTTDCQPSIGADIECVAVLVTPEIGPPSVNLLAPIVINRRNRRGIQAIRADLTYSHQFKLAAAAVCL